MIDQQDLVFRLRKRAEIRRQIQTRKSVQEGAPDRIADLLEEAADRGGDDYLCCREWRNQMLEMEMTDTKPTLPELIEHQQSLCENNPPNPVVYILTKEILASLKELQNIKSQPVPVEPDVMCHIRRDIEEFGFKVYGEK